MKPRLVPLALATLLATALPAPAADPEPAWPLEGKTLTLTVVPGARSEKRDAEPIEETLRFDRERVTFTAFAAHGFASASYSLEKKGKKWLFHAEATSPDGGKLVWDGDYRQDWFEGIVIWQRPKEKELNFSYAVKKEKEKKKK